MSILNRVFDFLMGSMFESEDEAYNRLLNKELKIKIRRIQRNNKQFLIEKQIKPFIQADFYKKTNMFMSKQQLERAAEYEFNFAKRQGFIDELNKLKINV